MLKQHIVLVVLCFCTSIFGQNNTREDYIREYYQIAIREMQSYGIPASITMAQGILESNNGNGYLAAEANNHFGIKCHEWTGPSVNKDDDEKNECFRKYFAAEDSYKDHSIFLTTRSRYAFLFDLKPNDYKGWAKGLKKAGYATDPKYPEKLIRIIEANELYLLDQYALAKNKKNVVLPIMIPQGDKKIISASSIDTSKIIKKPKANKIHTSDNGLHYVVNNGELSLEEIAKRHHLHQWEVYKFNDIDRHEGKLDFGQRIYLERKRSKVKDGKMTHTVLPGESMYEISQLYGLKIKSLYKMNQMQSGTQAQAGDVIKLNKKAILD